MPSACSSTWFSVLWFLADQWIVLLALPLLFHDLQNIFYHVKMLMVSLLGMTERYNVIRFYSTNY